MSTTAAGLGAGYALISGATGLASLATATTATLGPFDNTVATIGGPAYEYADLVINLGAATTLGTSAPVDVQAAAIWAEDGTNYDSSFVSNSQLYPLWSVRQVTFPSSGVSTQVIIVPNIPLRPNLGKIVVLNNTGVTLPAGTTATLYGFRGELA